MSARLSPAWWSALRWAVALVWLHQGVWNKILAVDPRHLEIVAAAPAFVPPRLALGTIGAIEGVFGVAVLLRWRPRLFAWLQIGALLAMNAAGIAFAAAKIPDVPGMLLMNLVFALAIWESPAMRVPSDRVVFGHMHEDPATELGLLDDLPVPSALVVASGGDLALALTAAGSAVSAVDANPAQIRLVRTKIAVARAVGAEQAAAWMTTDATAAVATLSGDDAQWWARRAASLRPGLCFCGSVDRSLRRAGRVLAWLYDAHPAAGPLRRMSRRAAAWLVGFFAAHLHGRAARMRVDAAAIALMRRRLEAALADVGGTANPLLQVLLGNGFGGDVPRVWSALGIRTWSRSVETLSLAAMPLSDALRARPRATLGLISVSNLPDVLDSPSWIELLDLAAAALAPGGYLIARSMLRAEPDWRHVAFEPRRPGADHSPLCPVVWIGRAR